MAVDQQMSAKAQQQMGLPEGFKAYSPGTFGGMNQADSSLNIDDKEFVYLENFVRLGNGNMRTLWDVGAPIYTAPTGKTVIYYVFYAIAMTQYCAIFLSDGSAVQYNMDTTALTTIATSGFYLASSGFLPCGRQWGSTYLLICNRNTPNDYWVWDGAALYTAGSASPQGVNLASVGFNYTSVPTVTAYGGHGTGMTFSVQISSGHVSEVVITNPGTGYLPGDVIQLAFSGGGSDTGGVLVAYLSPGSVGGVSISAPGSGYSTVPSVAFSGGGGVGAAGTAQISTGVVSIAVTNGGTGYTSAPAVSFTGGAGAGASAVATVSSGAVTSIAVTSPGAGYTSAPTVVFAGGGGVSAAATATLSGIVSGVLITAPGTGYTTAPTVAFSGGGGVGAIGVAVLQPKGVAGVTVVDPGSGYGGAPGAPATLLTFVGGGGSGATGTITLQGSSVASIVVTNPGSGYLDQPTVFITGAPGENSTATATANLQNGSVTSITLTNAGYGLISPVNVVITAPTGTGGVTATAEVLLVPQPIAYVTVTNPGQFYTSAPEAVISAGSNSSAYGTVSLMPFGVSGSALETYLARVWIVNPAIVPNQIVPPGDQWSFSAAGSVFDFSTADGGGAETNTDAFLQMQYVNLRQSSGYLYMFGDGSASVVSNVQTTGTPATTTFNYQNVDPQTGLSWRDSLEDFGKSTILANETGIYGLYGGSLTKISGKLDQFLSAMPEGTALYPANGGVQPSSAIATIFNIKHYLNLMTILDPQTGAPRNVMVLWDEKEWSVASQSISFTIIASQKVGSQYTAWGTEGSRIYPMFAQPSSGLQKRLATKQYGAESMFIQKQADSIYLQAQDKSVGLVGVSGTIQTSVSTIATLLSGAAPPLISGTYTTVLEQPAFESPDPTWPIWGSGLGGIAFTSISIEFSSNSPDFVLGNLVIGYTAAKAYR
jgi:hypothetical protein